jgi:hypothetical protein
MEMYMRIKGLYRLTMDFEGLTMVVWTGKR